MDRAYFVKLVDLLALFMYNRNSQEVDIHVVPALGKITIASVKGTGL